jgi:hypothetical protein
MVVLGVSRCWGCWRESSRAHWLAKIVYHANPSDPAVVGGAVLTNDDVRQTSELHRIGSKQVISDKTLVFGDVDEAEEEEGGEEVEHPVFAAGAAGDELEEGVGG